MSAKEVAAKLGDARKVGSAWRCRCPLHGGRSLVLRDGDGGRLLVTCWGGCNRLDVLAELRLRGLLDKPFRDVNKPRRPDRAAPVALRTARAMKIWNEAQSAAGTVTDLYLRGRGISFDEWPASLRFHSCCPRPRDKAGNLLTPLPAMLALVEHVERGPVAVHATYLRPDGSDKADLPKEQQKASFGPIGGGAVRLGAPRQGEPLVVGEGIETVLSVMVATGFSGWAALSAVGIEGLLLPEIANVIIAADNDCSGCGQREAQKAAQRWLSEGRSVRVAMPPDPGTDFNDMLRGRSDACTTEGCHVA